MEWPEGFMWGTGASSTQCEGAAPASDWLRWEREGHAPVSGEGNGFGTRYAEDFALLAGLGLTHHRLSIEWARIEPEQGRRDANEVARYREILSAATDTGVNPWVCLHHFTLPAWFAARGGFLADDWNDHWTRHVDFMAETFADLVYGWQPVNETNYYARIAYRQRRWPPGHDDVDEATRADVAIHLATAEAAARMRQTGRPVASIYGLSTAVAQDNDPASREFVERFYESSWNPGLRLFRDGVLAVPHASAVERPDLAGCFDLIGFSYYATIGAAAGHSAVHPPDASVSPLGYGIWADGLGLVLERLATEVPNTPLLVAEYGIGTQDDEVRAEYLRRGLEETASALARGIDVRGFFHWTAVDNYEWLHGYDVSFGIIDRDRTVRASAEVLRRR
ncbi:MAG: glycoside hydrolase family 1 protein [Actinobacteria bacterium]|nr:glycoside hydrolase family 1 protein [Actinomycetota bacterium]